MKVFSGTELQFTCQPPIEKVRIFVKQDGVFDKVGSEYTPGDIFNAREGEDGMVLLHDRNSAQLFGRVTFVPEVVAPSRPAHPIEDEGGSVIGIAPPYDETNDHIDLHKLRLDNDPHGHPLPIRHHADGSSSLSISDFSTVDAGSRLPLRSGEWKAGDERDTMEPGKAVIRGGTGMKIGEHVACPVGSVTNYLSNHDTPVELSTMDFGVPPSVDPLGQLPMGLGLGDGASLNSFVQDNKGYFSASTGHTVIDEEEGRVVNEILPHMEVPTIGVGLWDGSEVSHLPIETLEEQLLGDGEEPILPIPQEIVDCQVGPRTMWGTGAPIVGAGIRTPKKVDKERAIHAMYGGGPATAPQAEDRVHRATAPAPGTAEEMFPGIPRNPHCARPVIAQLADGWKPNARQQATERQSRPEPLDIIDDRHSCPGGYAAQVTKTVVNRGSDYGTPAENHQLTVDLWNAWLSRRLGMPIKMTAEDVCMLNCLQKQSRLAATTKDDSWLDVAGYTENVAMLRKDQRNTVGKSGKP